MQGHEKLLDEWVIGWSGGALMHMVIVKSDFCVFSVTLLFRTRSCEIEIQMMDLTSGEGVVKHTNILDRVIRISFCRIA
ncbi:hypothetical protein GMOD_00008790 [Pyrenophora seminiperda CCB06]|uniref:Uncharacterized protein n=1 Tax=Pyrenophora seminiperda CCB06 TaxID=1302712 RepID=A0A3M7M5X1_9PLEO|nr:hypothetical protein GMOD_00008790 [Pyrenophora seminiperda CCB06]